MSEPNKAEPAQGHTLASTEQSQSVESKPGQTGEVTTPGTSQEQAANQPKVVPEKYDLKPPKDSPLEAGDVERIAAYAKAQGLSQEEASKLLERDHQSLAAYADRQKQKWEETRSGWIDTIKSDKELGGDNMPKVAEVARRVIDRYASQSLRDALNETGFGNHPELVRVFYRIGKEMANDETILSNAPQTSKRSAAEILYGGAK